MSHSRLAFIVFAIGENMPISHQKISGTLSKSQCAGKTISELTSFALALAAVVPLALALAAVVPLALALAAVVIRLGGGRGHKGTNTSTIHVA